jgi:Ca2+-transporting ATPase
MNPDATGALRAGRPTAGLTDSEAAERLAEHGPNEVGGPPRVSLAARVGAQLRDPLILVLLAAVVLTVAIGDHPDAAVIALVIVVNTAVGTVQEARADRAVAALSAMSAPTARVVRSGEQRKVPAAEVVPGDSLVLGEGDVVPADAVVVQASALLVDESTVTGESVPVDKAAGSGDRGRLQAGTVVVRGRALASVTATGADSALGRIASLLRGRPAPTPLQQRLASLGRVLAAVAVGLCALVFVLGVVRHQSVEVMGVTAISLAVAAVPESLPAVVTLSLALGAREMAARNAVVRRLPAVETLGSVTVLATDKTGTLTEGRMVVERLWTPHGSVELTGTGYGPGGSLRADGRAPGPDLLHAVRELLTAAALCNDASLRRSDHEGGDWSALGDPTEAALLVAAAKAGCDHQRLVREAPRVSEAPFDSERRRMSTIHRQGTGQLRVCLKGAPEVVLAPAVLDEPAELLDEARRQTERLTADGFRVLAVAETLRSVLPARPQDAEHRLRLLGLAGISDPPKAAAAATLEACHRAGITTVLITGDHPVTAGTLAERIGLLAPGTGPGAVVTGPDLAAGRVKDVTAPRVFARTDPRQKLDIVQAWRSAGAVTAMTGDGVNDGPALRRADIGVAMGRRGTEVARQAADLVLADDELSSVVAAVEEGRRVYDNIRRFLVYGLSGGAAEILVMLLGPAFGLPVPLRAGQILWINLLTHGLTGVAMGAEATAPGTMDRPPLPPRQHVLGSGLWQKALSLGAVVCAVSFGAGLWAHGSGRPWQSILFLALLAAQLGVVLGLRERLFTRANLFLPAAVLASAALGIAAVGLPFLRDVLETVPLAWADLVAPVAAGAVGFLAARLSRGRRNGGRQARPADHRSE